MADLDKFIQLRTVIAETANEFGLQLTDYSVVPGEKMGQRPTVRLSLKLTPEALLSMQEREQKKIDKQFDSIIMNVDEDAPPQDVVNEIQTTIKEWMEEE